MPNDMLALSAEKKQDKRMKFYNAAGRINTNYAERNG